LLSHFQCEEEVRKQVENPIVLRVLKLWQKK